MTIFTKLLFANLPLRNTFLPAHNHKRNFIDFSKRSNVGLNISQHESLKIQEELLSKMRQENMKFLNKLRKEDFDLVQQVKSLDLFYDLSDEISKSNKENREILNKLYEFEYDIKWRTELLLEMKHSSCNVVHRAFEFIQTEILRKNNSNVLFNNNPNDLTILLDDKDFIKTLNKECKKNSLKYYDIQRSLDNLYYNTLKSSCQSNMREIIIDSQTITSNEFFLLKVIFQYYKISFLYFDENKKLIYK